MAPLHMASEDQMVGVALGQQAEDVEADNIQEGVAYKNNTECLLTAFQITNSYFQKRENHSIKYGPHSFALSEPELAFWNIP